MLLLKFLDPQNGVVSARSRAVQNLLKLDAGFAFATHKEMQQTTERIMTPWFVPMRPQPTERKRFGR